MKHKLMTMVGLLICSLITFTSCSSDEEEGTSIAPEHLHGTWYIVKQTWNDEAGTETKEYKNGDGGYVTFEKDNTGQYSAGSDQILEWSDKDNFRYTVSGSQINLERDMNTSSGQYISMATWRILSASDKSMTLQWSDPDEGLTITGVFKKVTNSGEDDEEDDGDTNGTTDARAIDLGLPSGLKWASCNVGASNPEEYGDYYAWGETEEKAVYDWSTYAYYQNGEYVKIGSDISGTAYDVAHVKWGGSWRMPTREEIKELCNNCTWKWIAYNGVNGQLVTGPNGNSIFLPAAGYRDGSGLYSEGYNGYYWSYTASENYSGRAYYLYFNSGYYGYWNSSYRYYAYTVRPVSE